MQIKDYQIVILGILISLGCIFSTYILSKSVVEFQRLQNQTIKVTGSASQQVTSDRAAWTIHFRTKAPTLKEGYANLTSDANKLKKYFVKNGISEDSIETSAINSYEIYRRYPNGKTSQEIEAYNVYQSITVKSNDINKLTELSKNANEIVNQDINVTSQNVQYYVSNLDNIKIEVAQKASKNAKERAESLVAGTNGKIGVMTNARLGVFQIVPIDSTEVENYGINDTSSIEKKVVATVSATFTVK